MSPKEPLFIGTIADFIRDLRRCDALKVMDSIDDPGFFRLGTFRKDYRGDDRSLDGAFFEVVAFDQNMERQVFYTSFIAYSVENCHRLRFWKRIIPNEGLVSYPLLSHFDDGADTIATIGFTYLAPSFIEKHCIIRRLLNMVDELRTLIPGGIFIECTGTSIVPQIALEAGRIEESALSCGAIDKLGEVRFDSRAIEHLCKKKAFTFHDEYNYFTLGKVYWSC